jgi:hypothetical protein
MFNANTAGDVLRNSHAGLTEVQCADGQVYF